MYPEPDLSYRTIVLGAELVPGSRAILKLGRAILTRELTCGDATGTQWRETRKHHSPRKEGGAWATACPQGARVQKQPFLEQITDAKALGEQSPGSFSALSHPFRWRPCAPNVH